MKREIIKTEISEKFSDGSQTTSKTERINEESNNGLLEAYGFFLLLLLTLFLTGITYQFVSNIVNRSNPNVEIQPIRKINQEI